MLPRTILGVLLISLLICSCGVKITGEVGDETMDRIESMFEDALGEIDDAEEADSEAQAVEDGTGSTFIGSFSKYADTCKEYGIQDNVRIYETETQVLFYKADEQYLTADIFEEDETLDLTVEGSFGLDDLDCICEVATDASIQCSCESDDADCAVIWGLL